MSDDDTYIYFDLTQWQPLADSGYEVQFSEQWAHYWTGMRPIRIRKMKGAREDVQTVVPETPRT